MSICFTWVTLYTKGHLPPVSANRELVNSYLNEKVPHPGYIIFGLALLWSRFLNYPRTVWLKLSYVLHQTAALCGRSLPVLYCQQQHFTASSLTSRKCFNIHGEWNFWQDYLCSLVLLQKTSCSIVIMKHLQFIQLQIRLWCQVSHKTRHFVDWMFYNKTCFASTLDIGVNSIGLIVGIKSRGEIDNQ